jgi:hypothetical protein
MFDGKIGSSNNAHDADQELCDLTSEVSCEKALPEQFDTVNRCIDMTSAVVRSPSVCVLWPLQLPTSAWRRYDTGAFDEVGEA